MAQTGYTPISLYYSTTASAAPTAGNLVAGELALNNNDGKLFYKDSSGVVQTLASKGTGTIGGSTTQVQYNNAGAFAGSANMTFDGTNLTLLGSLGIGASVGSNVKVAISGTLPTASNLSYSFRSLGTIPSTTTTAAWGFDSALATQAAAFTLAELFNYRATQGAIGATSAVTTQYGFAVTSGMAGATNNYGFHGNIASATGRYNLYMAGTADNYLAGSLGIGSVPLAGISLRINKNLTGDVTGYGVFNQGTVQSGTTTAFNYYSSLATAAASFTVSNYYHYFASQNVIGATSAVTNQFCYFVENTTTGATNDYGFYGNLAAATGVWNLYMNGTANNYLAGSLGIGTTGLTGISLAINKNLTGSTSCTVVESRGQIQSGVTAAALYFDTGLSTQAASFTVGFVIHYRAYQFPLGASSAITTQYGFVADSTLNSATNNMGFRGDIAAGTGRWNFYAAGTAANYMAGQLGIGTSPNASALLDVQSTTQGVRMPNMTTTQKNAISSPAAGLMVFDTTLAKLCVYSGAAWQTVTST